MKSFLNLVSFLALVNMLAILMLAGWLWYSDRLDVDRLNQVRDLFARTVTQEQADAEDAAADAATQAALTEAETRRLHPALSSDAQIRQSLLLKDEAHLAGRRLADERELLLSQIDAATSTLEQQETQFEETQENWESTVALDQARKADEQFAKAVQQLESIPPKQGKMIIIALVQSGKREEAVAYLNEMQPRSSAKVFREFKSPEETALATELLEEIRTFGVGTTEQENLGNADRDPID